MSHTDLWDFQANVDGARLAYQALRPIVLIKDKDLAATLDEEFALRCRPSSTSTRPPTASSTTPS